MDEKDLAYGASKAFLDKFAGTAAEKPAETLSSTWDYAFGWINYAAARKQAVREVKHQEFLLTIGDNISNIPDENIQEPKLSLIGPALESTKYYIDEKELRDLFINLISKSMDNRYNDKVNHAFVEVIKQLSPIDAYLLKKMQTKTMPVARYQLKFKESGAININNYFIIDEIFNSDQTSISLSNLQRLGLIDIPEDKPLKKKGSYEQFLETEEYLDIISTNKIVTFKKELDALFEELNNDEEAVFEQFKMNRETFNNAKNFEEVAIDKTHISTTSFGTAFYNVCII